MSTIVEMRNAIPQRRKTNWEVLSLFVSSFFMAGLMLRGAYDVAEWAFDFLR